MIIILNLDNKNMQIDKESKIINRVVWLDVARGLAFLAVIYHHLDKTSFFFKGVDNLYLPAYLSVFFFVSGYLYKTEVPFKSVLEQRTRTLLLPLLIFGTIMILLQHIFTFREEPVSWTDSFKGLIFQKGEDQLLWFVGALYIYSLVFYWIKKITGGGKFLLLVCLGLFVFNWIYTYIFQGIPLPWTVHFIGFGLSYMGLGCYYREIEGIIDGKINPVTFVVLMLIYIVIILFGKTCSFTGSKILIDSIVLSIIGIIITIYISKTSFIQKIHLVKFVGANSLFYFAFHGKVIALCTFLATFLLGKMNLLTSIEFSFISGFVIVLLTAMILILPAMIVNKYFPWMLGKGFKLWQ